MSSDVANNPRVVLGMTLYNNARHLREATNSILAQAFSDFVLVMLDDGSSDETERIAREYEKSDPRVRYFRHATRQGMVPTWREVFERATSLCPSAEYFAWVSDHDVWAPTWLAMLVQKLDVHQKTVLMYPMSPRIDDQGRDLDKTPRDFDTAGLNHPIDRWEKFCWEGFGSGDMVYGLIRVQALRKAGVFRSVLNPDRLLIAELLLQGQIRQIHKPLWFRRQSGEASVSRQRETLFAGDVPAGFALPPSLQHVLLLGREYAKARPAVTTRMRATYLAASAWRGFRKTETSKSFGRGVDNAHFLKKLAKKIVRTSIYYVLVTSHRIAARLRRMWKHTVYHIAMLTYRVGLRSRRNESDTR
ncbi:MAG: glycosyltransferase family 2 protein [Vicinamibacterales bacterium]